MAQSLRSEARCSAAWRDLIASVDVPCAALRPAPPSARREAPAAVARALRVPPELKRLPLVKAILVELRKGALSFRLP